VTDLTISSHPLSREYKQGLEQRIHGSLAFEHLSQLRLLGPLQAVSRIRSHRAQRCILAIEEPSSYATLPALKLLAVLTRARELQLVHPDHRRESFSRISALRSILDVFVASLDGVRARRTHRQGIRQLMRLPRISVHLRSRRTILYVNPNMWFGVRAGGALSHMTGVVNAFVDLGYRVDVVSAGSTALRGSATSHPVAETMQLGLPEETNYYRFQRKLLAQLRRLSGSGDYDFIYQRLSVHNFVGVLLSRLVGLPLVLEYNGSEVWAAENWGRPLKAREMAVGAEDVCLRHAHLVVVVSEALRREVIQRGVDPQRVVQYPNGFDPQLFNPERFRPEEVAACRAALSLPLDAVVSTFVGTFGKWHGVDVLARAIRRLVVEDREWLSANRVQFLLIGDGARMPEVRQILGESCSEFVTLTGLVSPDAVPLHLAASDILLAPHVANEDGSEFFGSPTKLFEYMAMSRPIVASKLAQIADVLSPGAFVRDLPADGPNHNTSDALALLVTPKSDEELARAVRILTANPQWRVRLGQLARRRALERHTWQRHVGEILASIKGVFDEQSQPSSAGSNQDARHRLSQG
jgi:glycosyltransferase involved in cell wall biosynthesis